MSSGFAGPVRSPRGIQTWVGTAPGDPVGRLRARVPVERGDPPVLTAVVEGRVVDGQMGLVVFRLRPPYDVPGPSQVLVRLADEMVEEREFPGQLQTVPLDRGILSLQSVYSAAGSARGAPRLLDVVAGWYRGAARGATVEAALGHVDAVATPRLRGDADFSAARRWFERLDDARRDGDWSAFGRAYDELRRLLRAGDSVR